MLNYNTLEITMIEDLNIRGNCRSKCTPKPNNKFISIFYKELSFFLIFFLLNDKALICYTFLLSFCLMNYKITYYTAIYSVLVVQQIMKLICFSVKLKIILFKAHNFCLFQLIVIIINILLIVALML